MQRPRFSRASNALRQRRGDVMPVILKRSLCCKDVFLAVEPIFWKFGECTKNNPKIMITFAGNKISLLCLLSMRRCNPKD